ncbi:glycosyltransferase family 4 protein [Gloeothece verrucosa]|uniref:Glycosyl transferase group 1 n=1 Tax=Gloeothece verrucosa (strain PCC 7822) TaxID=497965 RepID=E0ULK2_GLOV7|nr:glycosyltransferase family 1 protein [Gloeothece verrucosa]ADN17832.1 glycosyl transferase group 1 [Gloeothece verrucosa PCC 7822]
MKVLYDISLLGISYKYNTRTGAFRVAEKIAEIIATSKECDLSFCTFLCPELNEWLDPGELMIDCALSYLESCDKFSDINLATSTIEKYIHRKIRRTLVELNKKYNLNYISRIWQSILLKIIELMTNNNLLLTPSNLDKNDIFHSPFYPLPELSPSNPKLQRFITIHDIIPLLYPELVDKKNPGLIPLTHRIVNSIKSYDWVFCVSQSGKDDLCNYCPEIDPAKVFVTHLAPSKVFSSCSDPEKITAIRNKYNIPRDCPYILSVSAWVTRKNFPHLIHCFAQLLQEQKINDLYLVLVCVTIKNKLAEYEQILQEHENYNLLKERIIITDYISDEDLAALYSDALTFVYPSLYEGFGIPPLEAMQCGTPVITSNTSSLPEVVGDAGIMVDPRDRDELCHNLFQLYNNSNLREEMSLKSLEQAKKFSWEKFGQETIKAYKTAVLSQ